MSSVPTRSRGGSTSNRGAKSGTGRYASRGSRWGTFTNIRIVNKLLNGESRKMKIRKLLKQQENKFKKQYTRHHST
ncbi:hypothetical protein HanXRQr2_Chr13g0575331 [Helianthus annuus]|uniref:Uncharacterized protein n=1 Tax=Helianthus annuus TaxID=4232 RepID=A0A251UL52_HELAN|nr:hypothetical protein HanXRQr2_Chr13g0575331 [Helianthus annuus]KAJ0475938.1 hypothetical protein HanHA300_Chr13g0471411 [Helianthus annuus]KAJ0496739.1 hypothetical protein HanHA89_Chr13g0503261 [Helianthus annuus]KAJ0662784.1 hypothetical protein HanLR1_Chr13g0473601 [Helianthus annuus]